MATIRDSVFTPRINIVGDSLCNTYVDQCMTTNGYDDITEQIVDTVIDNYDFIKYKYKSKKSDEEISEKYKRIRRNRKLKAKVKNVIFNGDRCIVFWNDNTKTISKWDSRENYDPEKAILVCMARKLYEDTGYYNDVLKKYADDGWENYYKTFGKDITDMIDNTDRLINILRDDELWTNLP